MAGHALITDPLRFMLDRCKSHPPAKLGSHKVIYSEHIHSDKWPTTNAFYFYFFTASAKPKSYSLIHLYTYKTTPNTRSEYGILFKLYDFFRIWDWRTIISDFPFPIFDRWDMVTKYQSYASQDPAKLYHFLRFDYAPEGIKLVGFFDKSDGDYHKLSEVVRNTPLETRGILHGIEGKTFQIEPQTTYREIMHAVMGLFNFK